MSSKKSGPKRVFDKNKLIDIFLRNESALIRDNGQIIPPRDKIWSTIKRQHQIPSSEKAIYTDCLKWNNDRKKNQKEVSREISSDSDAFYEEELDSSLNELSLNDSDYADYTELVASKSKFFITISSETWKIIQPVPRNYSRAANQSHHRGKRVYYVLKPGAWTSLLAEKIAEHPKKIVCDWSFKRAKVSSSGKHYIGILGKCVTCESTLVGSLQNEPKEGENVTFKFVIDGFDENKHRNSKKKVKVTGSQAQSLAKSTKPAIVLHRKMAAKSGEMFETARGRVPTAGAIRNLQSREPQIDLRQIFSNLFYICKFHQNISPPFIRLDIRHFLLCTAVQINLDYTTCIQNRIESQK